MTEEREEYIKHLTRYEQETIISFNEDQRKASLYTYNNSLIIRVDAYCLNFPDLFRMVEEDHYGKYTSKTYEFPKKYVNIRQPRILTEEQREKLTQQLKKGREAKELNINSQDFNTGTDEDF